MMSAEEYRARVDALVGLADRCGDPDLILDLEATAQQWRRLAETADWQEAILATLAMGVTPTSVWPDERAEP